MVHEPVYELVTWGLTLSQVFPSYATSVAVVQLSVPETSLQFLSNEPRNGGGIRYDNIHHINQQGMYNVLFLDFHH